MAVLLAACRVTRRTFLQGTTLLGPIWGYWAVSLAHSLPTIISGSILFRTDPNPTQPNPPSRDPMFHNAAYAANLVALAAVSRVTLAERIRTRRQTWSRITDTPFMPTELHSALCCTLALPRICLRTPSPAMHHSPSIARHSYPCALANESQPVECQETFAHVATSYIIIRHSPRGSGPKVEDRPSQSLNPKCQGSEVCSARTTRLITTSLTASWRG